MINPILAKREENIRVHLEALVNKLITEEQFKVIEAKIKLGKLCLDLEEQIQGSYVTIMFYDQAENNIYHGAAPKFPVEFFDFFNKINKFNLFNESCGSCGAAVHTRKVVVTHILTSHLWNPLRDHFARCGFQTGWSIPFFRGQEVIGTFAIYHKYQKHVTTEEMNFVKEKIRQYQDSIHFLSQQYFAKNA